MDELFGTLFTVAIIVVQVLAWAKRIRDKSREDADAEPVSTPAPAGRAPPTRSAERPKAVVAPAAQPRMAKELGAVVGAVARAEQLRAELKALRVSLARVGPTGRVLAEIIDERLTPALDQALAESRALAQGLRAADPAVLLRVMSDPMAFDAPRRIHGIDRQARVLAQMAEWRVDPELGPHLADADAMAADMLDPIQRMAGVQGFAFPHQRPICAPADPGHEALWLGLLPEGYPVIFVPDDFGDDLYRQASIAHEVGHLLWLRVPGLQAEARQRLGLPEMGALLQWDGQALRGSLSWPYSAWLPELFADAVCALLLGPAALHGLTHSFENPDDVDDVVVAMAAARGYDEHPPAHLRVHLVADLLHRVGFDQEAKAIVAEWDAAHGHPEILALPTDGGTLVSLPFEQVEAFGKALVESLYELEWQAFDGHTLQDLPGFEMSPGLWARVGRRAQDLVRGEAFHDGARVALAAAIVARSAHPGRAPEIARNLRAAVLGLDADERHATTEAYGRRRVVRSASLLSEVRDAVLLAEILERPRPLGMRR